VQAVECSVRVGTDSTTGTVISASTTDDSFNTTGTFPLIFPGAKLWVTGFANAANNGEFTVQSATTTKIVVAPSNLTTEGAGPTVTIRNQNPPIIIQET
jgi:hypothetical protein